MKRVAIWTLIAANAILTAELAVRLTTDGSLVPMLARAEAQGALPRNPEPLMIPGEIPGSSNEVVYIVDIANEQLTAMSFDATNRQIRMMDNPIDLRKVFAQAVRAPR